MLRHIEIESMKREGALLKRIKGKLQIVDEAIENQKLQEDELIAIGVEEDAKMYLTVSQIRNLKGSADLLKQYQDSLVDRIVEYREELELDKEDGIARKNWLLH